MKRMTRVFCVLFCIFGMAAVQANYVHADIYVVDNVSTGIKVFNDSDSGDVYPIRAITDSLLNNPMGIAVDTNKIYVTSRDTNTVVTYNLDGTSGAALITGNGLDDPWGIAVDASNIYVANYSGTITIYKKSAPTDSPTIISGLSAPAGIAVDASSTGYIYVANSGNNQITVYNKPDVSLKGTISDTCLSAPIGIAIDGSYIYVANYENSKICVFTLSGTFHHSISPDAPDNTGLNVPYGIAVDANNIYVGNSNAGNILAFALTANGNVPPARTIPGGHSTLSSPVFIAKGPATHPEAPINLTATATSDSQITLSWTDNSTNETGFKIFRNGTELTPSPKASTATTNTERKVLTFPDTGLNCETTYTYTVKATNAVGDSADSASASAKTLTCSTAPAAPTGLSVTIVSSTQIHLSWTDNSSNETGFNIYRGVTLIKTTAPNVTSYQDKDVICATSYIYKVTATVSGSESSPITMDATTSACNAAPTATNLSISGTLASGQTLTGNYTYNDTESNPQGTSTFKWYTSAVADCSVKTEIATATSATYTLTSAEIGKYVCFGVTPVATAGVLTGTEAIAKTSATVSANTPPTATDISISGTFFAGQTLTGNYAYNDAETDLQGTSTFKWYSCSNAGCSDKTPIANAVSKTFALTSAEVGKYICFGITPVAAVGTSPGSEVISPASGSKITNTLGDVNADGNVDLGDAILVLRILAGISVTETINIYADVNADNKIGIEELGYILQKVAELRLSI